MTPGFDKLSECIKMLRITNKRAEEKSHGQKMGETIINPNKGESENTEKNV